MRLFKWNSQQAPLTYEECWYDDFPLFYFGPGKRNPYTVGNSFNHIFVSGASGSGKTTGSLATISRAYLAAGYGGLVLCSKESDKADWKLYCDQTGRGDDLVIVSAEDGMPFRFNFLNYELRRKGRGAGSVTNIVDLFSTIMDIIENNTKEAMSEDFWDRTALQMVGFAVIVLSLCEEPLTVKNIKRLITTAPQKGQVSDRDWQATSYCAQRMDEAYRRPKTPRQLGDLEAALDYFTQDLPELGSRTRSSIEMTVSSIAAKFLIGDVREMLCSPVTNIVPELLWQGGKIVVLDFPTDKEGLIIQGVIKYCFQRAMLRRDVAAFPRPVFLAMDEYHTHMSSYDYRFIAEARSARLAVLMATQNISNMYSVLGPGARDQANSLLAENSI